MHNEKILCLGITAHVDAAKTTLAEAMLYEAGQLKKRGRVDHRDSTLDYEDFERARGITAFAKQAVFSFERTVFYLIDTPGHTDLWAETKRGLRVPDAAILVISGNEGIQADTGTIWEQLQSMNIPVWLFVSKMDLNGCDQDNLLEELKRQLSDAVTDFTVSREILLENIAELDEECLDAYLENGDIPDDVLSKAISKRRIVPCFFGSGLHSQGVREFMTALDRWAESPEWPDDFSALCYKISRDARGQRLSQVRITGGTLTVRDLVRYSRGSGAVLEEKVTGIRIYSGAHYDTVESVRAGQVCSLLGLSKTEAGSILGERTEQASKKTEAVRRYKLRFKSKQDPVVLMAQLLELSEELPELQPISDGDSISVCVTGKMQGEVLKALLAERFGLQAELQEGRLVYKETVTRRVEGIGHFEPLRHYAEVHLILEPLPPGSGVQIESICPEDDLNRNWQNLILDALSSEKLPGVLTGSELTDIRICLASGRAHPKHTEGGDFREASRRALRQGLMQAECRLLEPIYHFELSLPAEQIGRAISDFRAMHAELSAPKQDKKLAMLSGEVPVSAFGDYPETLLSYTHGLGNITVQFAGYKPCHDEASVLDRFNYESARDNNWPADSIFCAHGSGFSVPWQNVREYMHLPSVLEENDRRAMNEASVHRVQRIEDRELEAIMLREFGPIRRPSVGIAAAKPAEEKNPADRTATDTAGKRAVVIDGYNFIFGEAELKKIAQDNLSTARERLMDRFANYCGFTGQEGILVFDGFRTAGNPGSKTSHANIHVVYTAEGESADAYIEKFASEIGKNDRVSVVTGDMMIRVSAMRSGVLRVSPAEFSLELKETEKQLNDVLMKSNLLAHKTRGEDLVTTK